MAVLGPTAVAHKWAGDALLCSHVGAGAISSRVGSMAIGVPASFADRLSVLGMHLARGSMLGGDRRLVNVADHRSVERSVWVNR